MEIAGQCRFTDVTTAFFQVRTLMEGAPAFMGWAAMGSLYFLPILL